MLFDALNFSNNSMVGLPREFINSYKAETVVTAHIANDLAITATDFPKQDLTNFLLAIRFAVDSTHMDDLVRTGNDVTPITNWIVQIIHFMPLIMLILLVSRF
jgi:hypothetical protein